MNSLVNELDHLSLGYQPDIEVAEGLSRITMALIIGPMAVGKSACIKTVTDLDSEFGRVQSFTTRPIESRDSPDEFRFLEHDEPTLTELLSRAKKGALVQYAIHPTTGYVYGSELIDYSHPYMMLETLSSGVALLRELPFGKLAEITIVAPPEDWVARFSSRVGNNYKQATKRLLEGEQSLQWSLDQGDSISWVNNPVGLLDQTASEVNGIIRGNLEPNKAVRVVGEQLLKAIRLLNKE
jgi:guanylate kinase